MVKPTLVAGILAAIIISTVLVLSLFINVAPTVDRIIKPVITDTNVEVVESTDKYLVLEGDFYKNRKCLVLEIKAQAFTPSLSVESPLNIKRPSWFIAPTLNSGFRNNDIGWNRWGPWQVDLPGAYKSDTEIRLEAIHRCNGLYSIQSVVITMPIEKLKNLYLKSSK